ncbi:hypothetical protein RchiOBHm_Chr6g0289461 [Rosa chinensis]|uniref:Uncharacterized protein n=1 Tax=Rosa chinensis TaxID=74649 RepID=A0A2P6PVM3_ROSCH|nr:hypothetical protein RchiOBHm_Chr6g0289461 [Rosa chinensis]
MYVHMFQSYRKSAGIIFSVAKVEEHGDRQLLRSIGGAILLGYTDLESTMNKRISYTNIHKALGLSSPPLRLRLWYLSLSGSVISSFLFKGSLIFGRVNNLLI